MNKFVRFNKKMQRIRENKRMKKIRTLILMIRIRIFRRKNTTNLVEWSLILLNSKRG